MNTKQTYKENYINLETHTFVGCCDGDAIGASLGAKDGALLGSSVGINVGFIALQIKRCNAN